MKLKPCPFCGKNVADLGTVAEQELLDSDNENYALYSSLYSVECNFLNGGCGASIGQFYDHPEQAAEAWNRRAKNG